MIQTSYVPLEHPYQIIEYQGVLGIQIGTLIVTLDKSDESESGYAIETHSHPVVSYVNNRIHTDMKIHRSLSLPRPYEGVVWDKVELHELRTLVREGESLSWYDFMDYCRRLRLGELEGTNMNVDAAIMDNFGMLLDWGINIGLPNSSKSGDKLFVEIDSIAKYDDKEYLLTEGDMGIVVRYGDKFLMMGQIFAQADNYISLMKFFDIDVYEVKFWTQDLFLQDLTNDINEKWSEHHRENMPSPEDDDEYDVLWAAEDLAEPEPDK